jgi:hypothetical protein
MRPNEERTFKVEIPGLGFSFRRRRTSFELFPHYITRKTMGWCVSHTVGLPFYIKKNYLKAKEEGLWKLKIFHHAKNTPNLQKNPLKETQKNPSRYIITLLTNLKFQTQTEMSCFKNPHIKIIIKTYYYYYYYYLGAKFH